MSDERAIHYEAQKDDADEWGDATSPAKPRRRLASMFSVRLAPAEAGLIRQAAGSRGMSVSSFLRTAALAMAGECEGCVNGCHEAHCPSRYPDHCDYPVCAEHPEPHVHEWEAAEVCHYYPGVAATLIHEALICDGCDELACLVCEADPR